MTDLPPVQYIEQAKKEIGNLTYPIATHTKALIEGAGEVASLLDALASDCENTDGWQDASHTCHQAAATIAALKAEIERLTEREAQARLDGVRGGIEAAACAQPPTAQDPRESVHQRGHFDGIIEYAKAIRALDAEAIAKGERVMNEHWFWYSGSTDEWYTNGPFQTRDEAVAALDGYGGYVIEAQKQRLKFSAKALIEAQYYEADELFSYENGDDPDGPGDEAEADLQKLLDAWTDKWRKEFTQPSLFAASRNGERIEPHARSAALSDLIAGDADLIDGGK